MTDDQRRKWVAIAGFRPIAARGASRIGAGLEAGDRHPDQRRIGRGPREIGQKNAGEFFFLGR